MLDQNMTLSLVLQALQISNSALNHSQAIRDVSTDSRHLQEGDLFIALRGEHFDGHDFVADSLQAGVCAVVVDQDFDCQSIPHSEQGKLLIVENTLLAYGLIAKAYRALFNIPLIALTGSAGKTSSKEMLASILSACGSVCATKANFNNEIGVPKTLLQLSQQADYAVVEMGAAKPNDIAYLMQFAQADVGLLTNVHPAHIEGFGSLDNVAKTKAEIFTCLEKNKTAIINLDDQYADYWLGLAIDKRVITFSLEQKNADVFADEIVLTSAGIAFNLHYQGQVRAINLASLGRFNVANALGAAAAALAIGVDLNAIASGLAAFSGVEGRMQPITLDAKGLEGVLLNDTYNANPGAVKAAISTVANFSGEKVVVLGTMGELGEDSKALHKEVVDFALEQDIQQLYLIGEQWPQLNDLDNSNVLLAQFKNKTDVLEALLANWQQQQSVLIKGSRSMKMETLIQNLSALANSQQEQC